MRVTVAAAAGADRLVLSDCAGRVAHVLLLRVLKQREPWKSGAPVDDNLVWFTLHAIANAVVVALALPDTLHLLMHPLDAFSESQGLTQGVVMAIHLYHVLGFKLSMDDKIHHGVSVGVVGNMAYMFRLGRSLLLSTSSPSPPAFSLHHRLLSSLPDLGRPRSDPPSSAVSARA
jgi:hypothetical protein